jgi:ATP-independent RNA helicase DbpA
MFANRSTSVLVATDVAARGLDIDALDMVINVELARDSEIHIHRVGRTGRAGEKGIAISLVAPSEAHRAQAIEQLQKSPLNWDQVDNLTSQGGGPLLPLMSTLCIGAGRKDKVRPRRAFPAPRSARSRFSTSRPMWPWNAGSPSKPCSA